MKNNENGLPNNIASELQDVMSTLQNARGDNETYGMYINNAVKLNQMQIAYDDMQEKIRKNTADIKARNRQIKLEEKKHDDEVKEKTKLRLIEGVKLKNQHAEHMKELEINKIKAENENLMLKQNILKIEKDIKISRWQTRFKFAAALITIGIAFVSELNQMHFERMENGLVPKRVGKYDGMINKAGEVFMK